MISIDKDVIKQAVRRDNPDLKKSVLEKIADRIKMDTDPRLEQNVAEWAQGQKISDLWIGKYCVNAIMSIRGDKNFIDALDAMNLYLADEKAGVWKIWRTRA